MCCKSFYLPVGGLGQLGTGLAKQLRKIYGRDNIILSDIAPYSDSNDNYFVTIIENEYDITTNQYGITSCSAMISRPRTL